MEDSGWTKTTLPMGSCFPGNGALARHHYWVTTSAGQSEHMFIYSVIEFNQFNQDLFEMIDGNLKSFECRQIMGKNVK